MHHLTRHVNNDMEEGGMSWEEEVTDGKWK